MFILKNWPKKLALLALLSLGLFWLLDDSNTKHQYPADREGVAQKNEYYLGRDDPAYFKANQVSVSHASIDLNGKLTGFLNDPDNIDSPITVSLYKLSRNEQTNFVNELITTFVARKKDALTNNYILDYQIPIANKCTPLALYAIDPGSKSLVALYFHADFEYWGPRFTRPCKGLLPYPTLVIKSPTKDFSTSSKKILITGICNANFKAIEVRGDILKNFEAQCDELGGFGVYVALKRACGNTPNKIIISQRNPQGITITDTRIISGTLPCPKKPNL